MIKCPKCKEENRDFDRYCLYCGNSLEKEVEMKKRYKELENQRKLEEKKETERKEQENSKTYRDYNRRYNRKTSKNIKNINSGKITKDRFRTRALSGIESFFRKEFKAIPILLTMIVPGLGFVYYRRWKKTVFFVLLTAVIFLYFFSNIVGRAIYVIYWVVLLILTHNEAP